MFRPLLLAEAAGLKQYDVIVGIDGKEIENATDLQTILYTKKVGDEIEVTYYREQHKNTVKVSLSLDRSSLEKNKPKTTFQWKVVFLDFK